MLLIPIETEGHVADAVVLVLSADNLERMREADPAEVVLRECGKHLINPTILVCYEPSPAAGLTAALHRHDLSAVLKHLRRGFRFRPDRGDHDRGPERLSEQG